MSPAFLFFRSYWADEHFSKLSAVFCCCRHFALKCDTVILETLIVNTLWQRVLLLLSSPLERAFLFSASLISSVCRASEEKATSLTAMAARLHNHFDIINALQRKVYPGGKTKPHFTVHAPPHESSSREVPFRASISLWHHQTKPPSSPPAPTWNYFLSFLPAVEHMPEALKAHVWLEDQKWHLKLCQSRRWGRGLEG